MQGRQSRVKGYGRGSEGMSDLCATVHARAQFEDLARQWEQIASDIEKYRQQIDCFGLSADLLIKRERGNPDGGESKCLVQ